MARRFGRNQKRKLRLEAKISQDLAQSWARQFAEANARAENSRMEEWRIRQQMADVVSRLQALLGEHTAVLPARLIEGDLHPGERELRMEHVPNPPRGFPIWGAETFAPRRVEELIHKLEARLEIDPSARRAIHFKARVNFGPVRVANSYVVDPREAYFASDSGLAIQDPNRIATGLAKEMVKFFNRAYTRCPKTGRWLEKEEKT